METSIPILASLVGILTVLQGWQMFTAFRKKKNNNPGHSSPDGYLKKLDDILEQLGNMTLVLSRMEQRLNDCWDKIND